MLSFFISGCVTFRFSGNGEIDENPYVRALKPLKKISGIGTVTLTSSNGLPTFWQNFEAGMLSFLCSITSIRSQSLKCIVENSTGSSFAHFNY